MTVWIVLIVVVVLGLAVVALELTLKWRADRSDPYVTLSDRKNRLVDLLKKE